MDQVNKHWKPLAVGLTAATVAGLAFYYMSSSKKEQAMVEDIEEAVKAVSGKDWPNMNRIVDPSKTKNEEKAQFKRWSEKVFKKFIKNHGEFSTDKDGCLNLEDFMMTYSLIEIKARIDLHDSRNADLERKIPLFTKAFYEKFESAEDATAAK